MNVPDDPNWVGNRCVSCKERRTPDGHDPCIANLPGVLFACCGHGKEEGYIKFIDGRVLRFNATEVTLDIPSVKTSDEVPIYQLRSSRIFNFKTKRVQLKRYDTIRNIRKIKST